MQKCNHNSTLYILHSTLHTELLTDVIVQALAAFGAEALAAVDEQVPLLFREPAVDHFAGDSVFHHAKHQTRVEIVAGPNGAHNLNVRWNGVIFA